MKCPVASFEMSMGLRGLWAACILKLWAMFLCCWRSCVVCLALELIGSWVVLGFPVGGVGRVACQGILVREACIGVLVDGAGSLLSGVQ